MNFIRKVFERPKNVDFFSVPQLKTVVPDKKFNTISMISGNGEQGIRDGFVRDAIYDSPIGLAVDKKENIYVCDHENHVIRVISSANNNVAVFAGVVGVSGSTDGSNKNALFNLPTYIAFDSRNNGLAVVDSGNKAVRYIRNGVVSTIGSAAPDFTPFAICYDSANNCFYVSDKVNNKVHTLTFNSTDSVWSRVVLLDSTFVQQPWGICVHNDVLFVVEPANHVIKAIHLKFFVMMVIGRLGIAGHVDSNVLSEVCFSKPVGISADTTEAKLYVTDVGNKCIRVVDLSNGNITTIKSAKFGFTPGVYSFEAPFAIGCGWYSNYVSDMSNNCIYEIFSSTQGKDKVAETFANSTLPSYNTGNFVGTQGSMLPGNFTGSQGGSVHDILEVQDELDYSIGMDNEKRILLLRVIDATQCQISMIQVDERGKPNVTPLMRDKSTMMQFTRPFSFTWNHVSKKWCGISITEYVEFDINKNKAQVEAYALDATVQSEFVFKAIAIGPCGNVYLSTSTIVYRLVRRNITGNLIGKTALAQVCTSPEMIKELAVDKRGRIYMMTGNRIRVNYGDFKMPPLQSPTYMFYSQTHDALFVCDGDTILRFSPNAVRTEVFKLPRGKIDMACQYGPRTLFTHIIDGKKSFRVITINKDNDMLFRPILNIDLNPQCKKHAFKEGSMVEGALQNAGFMDGKINATGCVLKKAQDGIFFLEKEEKDTLRFIPHLVEKIDENDDGITVAFAVNIPKQDMKKDDMIFEIVKKNSEQQVVRVSVSDNGQCILSSKTMEVKSQKGYIETGAWHLYAIKIGRDVVFFKDGEQHTVVAGEQFDVSLKNLTHNNFNFFKKIKVNVRQILLFDTKLSGQQMKGLFKLYFQVHQPASVQIATSVPATVPIPRQGGDDKPGLVKKNLDKAAQLVKAITAKLQKPTDADLAVMQKKMKELDETIQEIAKNADNEQDKGELEKLRNQRALLKDNLVEEMRRDGIQDLVKDMAKVNKAIKGLTDDLSGIFKVNGVTGGLTEYKKRMSHIAAVTKDVNARFNKLDVKDKALVDMKKQIAERFKQLDDEFERELHEAHVKDVNAKLQDVDKMIGNLEDGLQKLLAKRDFTEATALYNRKQAVINDKLQAAQKDATELRGTNKDALLTLKGLHTKLKGLKELSTARDKRDDDGKKNEKGRKDERGSRDERDKKDDRDRKDERDKKDERDRKDERDKKDDRDMKDARDRKEEQDKKAERDMKDERDRKEEQDKKAERDRKDERDRNDERDRKAERDKMDIAKGQNATSSKSPNVSTTPTKDDNDKGKNNNDKNSKDKKTGKVERFINWFGSIQERFTNNGVPPTVCSAIRRFNEVASYNVASPDSYAPESSILVDTSGMCNNLQVNVFKENYDEKSRSIMLHKNAFAMSNPINNFRLTNSWTFEVTIKFNANSMNSTLFAYTPDNGTRGLCVSFVGGYLMVTNGDSINTANGRSAIVGVPNVQFKNATWYHILIDSNSKVWVNGVEMQTALSGLKAQLATLLQPTPTTRLFIGDPRGKDSFSGNFRLIKAYDDVVGSEASKKYAASGVATL